MKTYNTIHEAYIGSIADVLDNPDYICSPRGQQIYEKVDYSFRVLHPEAVSIVTKDPERNIVIAEYTKKEMDWYMSGDNSVESAGKCSKFWEKLDNGDGTVNSNYGKLIFFDKSLGNGKYEYHRTAASYIEDGKPVIKQFNEEVMRSPWEWAKMSLINDKDTRQAILKFSRPDHHWDGNKDFVCTISGNFLIRDNKLNLSILMRSNDVTLGICYDICFFVSLLDKMIEELKPYYPDLQKGSYTHIAHSYHAYVRDFAKINKMLGR